MLIFPLLVVASGALFFSLKGTFPVGKLWGAVIILGGAFYLPHFILCFLNPKADELLLPLSSLLATFGLTFIARLDPALASRQFLWLLLGSGVLAFVLIFLPSYRPLGEYQYLYMLLGLGLLGVTLLWGTEVRGMRGWLEMKGVRFQPVELVKLLLVLFLASYFQQHRELLARGGRRFAFFTLPPPQSLGPLFVIWGLSLLFLIFQRDLGAALIFFFTFLLLLYLATGKGSYLWEGILLFGGGFVIACFFFPHVALRVAVWLNPWAQFETGGYQIAQALFALGAGGIWGTGFGLGLPGFIPAASTDFIFVAFAEETGLAGALGLLTLYLLFILRGYKIALEVKEEFGLLLAAGLTSLFTLQTLVNVAGVTKLLPLTGITLPFMSYGGSSLLVNYLLLALLLKIGPAGQP